MSDAGLNETGGGASKPARPVLPDPMSARPRVNPDVSDAAPQEGPPDLELVERSCEGDTSAFGKLVDRYRGKIYAMLYQMVQNEQDAWDLSQDAFVKAWKALPSFRRTSAFYTWLYRIAMNGALDWLRKRSRSHTVSLDEAGPEGLAAMGPLKDHSTPETPDQTIERHDVASRIESALGELSEDHRAVIVLRELHGMQYEEIAEAVGCSLGTVMSRLFYARKKLQSTLRDVYERL